MNARLVLAFAALTSFAAGPSIAHANAGGQYRQEISRKNRGLIIFKIDRSGSMKDAFGKVGSISKAQAVHTLTNDALQNFMRMSHDGDGVRDYMDVAVIAIGGKNEATVLVPPTPIGKLQNAVKGVVTAKSGAKMGVWVDHKDPAAAEGSTPIKQGLELAHDLARDWIASNPHAYPPTVISVTDGMASEQHRGEWYEQEDHVVEAAATKLKGLKTSDGNVLLLMAHISGNATAKEVKFPTHDGDLDRHGKLLFKLASELPAPMRRSAGLAEGAKGMMSQADLAGLIDMYNLGTQSTIPTGLRLSTNQNGD